MLRTSIRNEDIEKMKLSGKTALITGGAKRIGKAIAFALACNGVNIAIHYKSSEEEAKAMAKEIENLGVKAWITQADLSIPSEVEKLIPNIIEKAGNLDILINNASIFDRSKLTEFSDEVLIENIRTNAFAPLLLARAFAKQKIQGAIINLLDTRIIEYDKEHSAYHISKLMLFSLTKMMALEFAPLIRVNAISPGLILPPPGQDISYLEKLSVTNPLKKIGSPDDITNAVLFLLNSDFITGQVIFVDGGYHLKGNIYV